MAKLCQIWSHWSQLHIVRRQEIIEPFLGIFLHTRIDTLWTIYKQTYLEAFNKTRILCFVASRHPISGHFFRPYFNMFSLNWITKSFIYIHQQSSKAFVHTFKWNQVCNGVWLPWMLSLVQCDQIGQVLKVRGDKFSYKSSPNIWWLLGPFWKTSLFM